MESKDSLTQYAVKQLTNAAMLCLALASMCLMWPQSTHAQDMAAIRAACTADAKKFCAAVQPGGGRVVACLKEHKDELSDGCKKAAGLPVGSSGSSASSDDTSSASSSASDDQPTTPAAPAKPSPASKSAPAKSIPNKSGPATTALAKNTSYNGAEKFVQRIINDADHQGLRAATVHVPEKWTFGSKIEWHYGWVEYPLSYSSHAESPDNAEAYYQYPLMRMDGIEVAPQLRQYNKGQAKPGDRPPNTKRCRSHSRQSWGNLRSGI